MAPPAYLSVINISTSTTTVFGYTLASGATIELIAAGVSRADAIQSLLNGELYEKLVGRQIALTNASSDLFSLGAGQEIEALFVYIGYFQARLGLEEYKYPFQFSNLGYLKTITQPFLHVGSGSLETYNIVSSAACTLRSIKALNNSGSTLYLHTFDANSLPIDGTPPDRTPIPIGAGSVNGDQWEGGTVMFNGCVAALSSTLATLTIIVSNDAWFDAEVL